MWPDVPQVLSKLAQGNRRSVLVSEVQVLQDIAAHLPNHEHLPSIKDVYEVRAGAKCIPQVGGLLWAR